MSQTYAPSRLVNGWRIAGWGSLAALLCLPALAMQFTEEVAWTGSDFVIAAILLGLLGLAVEGAFRLRRAGPGRTGLLIASVTGFLTLWANAAVGFIGEEDAINQFFFYIVLAVAMVAVFSRARARIVAGACAAAALAHPVLGLVAEATMPGHAVEWGVLAVFGGSWALAALLLFKPDQTSRA